MLSSIRYTGIDKEEREDEPVYFKPKNIGTNPCDNVQKKAGGFPQRDNLKDDGTGKYLWLRL